MVAGNEHLLIPFIDLANHRSADKHTAKLKRSATATESRIEMYADCSIDAGEEITHDYLASDGDFLDLFEQYGFFYNESLIHTVEIGCSVELLWKMIGGGEADSEVTDARAQTSHAHQRFCELIDQGCDRKLDAWWIPDVRLESSPLVEAISVCFGQASTHKVAEYIKQLVIDHLAQYGATSREADEAALKELDVVNSEGDTYPCGVKGLNHNSIRLLLQLAVFERVFLEKVLVACTVMGTDEGLN
jgi:hypothetical protein